MARTDDCKVREVIETDSDKSLASFIRTANKLTDRVSKKATQEGISVTSEDLLEIETYLAAHFYALFDPQPQSLNAGKSSTTYQGATGEGLKSTFWGQTALALDPTGCLASLSSGNVASASWIGTK